MRAVFLSIIVLIALIFPAQAASLKLELADERVDITTGFNGARLVLFGVTDQPSADIVITLTGPENTVVVRKKGRVGGAWMNIDTLEFRRVPSYYDVAATRAESVLASPAILRAEKIGVANLDFYPEDASRDEVNVEYFRNALVSARQGKGFYPLKHKAVVFMEPTFFRVTFDLPPGVPTGIYTVKGMLLQDEKILAVETKHLQVGQVGFNARIYTFATRDAFFYGLFSILIAFASGWAAFTFLRRD